MYYMVPRRPRPVLEVSKPIEYYTQENIFKRHVYQPPVTQTYYHPPPKIFYQPPPMPYGYLEPPRAYNYYIPYYYISPPRYQQYIYWPPAYRLK
ncbi:hypothetical protein [[Eubacterium] cellulosolvens]